MKKVFFILCCIFVLSFIFPGSVFAEKYRFRYNYRDGEKFNLKLSGRTTYMSSGNDAAQKVNAKALVEIERKRKDEFDVKVTCLFMDKKDASPDFNVKQLHMSDTGQVVKNTYSVFGKNVSKKKNKNSGIVMIKFPEKAISPGYTWKTYEEGKFDYGLYLKIEDKWTLEKIVKKGSRKHAYFKANIYMKSLDRNLESRGIIRVIHDMNSGTDIKGVFDIEHNYSGNGISQTTGQYREWELEKVKIAPIDDWD